MASDEIEFKDGDRAFHIAWWGSIPVYFTPVIMVYGFLSGKPIVIPFIIVGVIAFALLGYLRYSKERKQSEAWVREWLKAQE